MASTKLRGGLTSLDCSSPKVLALEKVKANGRYDTTSTRVRHASPISGRQDLDIIKAVLPSQVSRRETPKT